VFRRKKRPDAAKRAELKSAKYIHITRTENGWCIEAIGPQHRQAVSKSWLEAIVIATKFVRGERLPA